MEKKDSNPGTLTMQSDRFFNALKGHGALCCLIILPLESHGYAARNSIMHALWETDRWLQKYCVMNGRDANANPDASVDDVSRAVGSESKALAAERVGGMEDHQGIRLFFPDDHPCEHDEPIMEVGGWSEKPQLMSRLPAREVFILVDLIHIAVQDRSHKLCFDVL